MKSRLIDTSTSNRLGQKAHFQTTLLNFARVMALILNPKYLLQENMRCVLQMSMGIRRIAGLSFHSSHQPALIRIHQRDTVSIKEEAPKEAAHEHFQKWTKDGPLVHSNSNVG